MVQSITQPSSQIGGSGFKRRKIKEWKNIDFPDLVLEMKMVVIFFSDVEVICYFGGNGSGVIHEGSLDSDSSYSDLQLLSDELCYLSWAVVRAYVCS